MSRGLGGIQRELEVLMSRDPEHKWTARELAALYYGTTEAAVSLQQSRLVRRSVTGLARRGLVRATDRKPVDGTPQARLYRWVG